MMKNSCKITVKKKCEVCGTEMEDPLATHCSESCLRESVAKSKKFDPNSVKKRKP